MIELRHPTELNIWQVYRQAKMLTKHTSRASSADWYKDAMQVDRQWHIWIDGGEAVISCIFDRRTNTWKEGPEVPSLKALHSKPGPDSQEGSSEVIDAFRKTVREILASKEFGPKAKSLGVILHVAEEFAVNDLAPEYAMEDDFERIRELTIVDPMEALGDSSVDPLAHSWRILPYWGISEGERRSVAIMLSRRYFELINSLRSYGEERNIPIIASAHAAPLEAVMLLPLLLDKRDGNGDIVLFQYRNFSAMAVLDPSGELVQIRALQHRSNANHPSGLGEILVNTSALMNLKNPAVHIVPMSRINQDGLIQDLELYFASRSPMNIGFIDIQEMELTRKIPGGKLELILASEEDFEATFRASSLSETKSFTNLANGWAAQDFYGLSEEEKSFYPSQRDLKLLKSFGYIKMVLIIGFMGLVSWTAVEVASTITTRAWRLSETDASASNLELAKLNKEKSKIEYWENMMAPRSEGWLVMEVPLRLFPPDSGIIITECDYNAQGETADKRSKKIAFERRWVVKGYASETGVARLSKLSSNTFLKAEFERISQEMQSEAFNPSFDSRALSVTMQQQQGQMPSGVVNSSVARHFRTSFELTILQSFSDEDSLAINIEPPRAGGQSN